MPSSEDTRTSAARRSLPLAPLPANNAPHTPLVAAPQLATSYSNNTLSKQRGHSRTRSFLTGLLKPSAGPKRASLPPPPTTSSRPSQTQVTAGDAGLRAPAARRKRVSAPADFKGKASVSSPRLLPSPYSPTMGSPPRSISRSSSYLDAKPLPLDGDQKMRLAAWEWGGDGDEREYLETEAPEQAYDKGKSRAYDHEDEDDEHGPAAQRAWQGWLRTSTVDDLGNLRPSYSMPEGISRFSVASDTPSTIAFPGPSFAAPYTDVDPHTSHHFIPAGQRNLSPIPETEAAIDDNASSRSALIRSPVFPLRAGPSTVTSRPVLHINPGLPPSRKPSNMSMSVYSRHSIIEQENDDAPEPDAHLRSYFSPDTPAPVSLEGLAIRGASPALSPSTPAPPLPSLDAHAAVEPLSAPSLPSQSALSAKPSFSRFRWDSSTSSITTVTSLAGERTPSSLFDESYLPAPSSVLTAATSTFEVEATAAEGDDGAEKGAYVHERGMWREDWRWTMLRRSLLVVDRELAPEITLEVALEQGGISDALRRAAQAQEEAMLAVEQKLAQPPAAVEPPAPAPAVIEPSVPEPAVVETPAPEPAVKAAPVSDRPLTPAKEDAADVPAIPATPVVPIRPAPASPVVLAAPAAPVPAPAPAPVLLPLSALPHHLREKALPPIPDNASIFTVDRRNDEEEEEEVVRIEVYCQRELVRRTKDRYERYVLERTMLYGEDADGTAV
ncbi:hypothetical protein JCM10450v2_001277 [Rhodotorula kratochvilovae]